MARIAGGGRYLNVGMGGRNGHRSPFPPRTARLGLALATAMPRWEQQSRSGCRDLFDLGPVAAWRDSTATADSTASHTSATSPIAGWPESIPRPAERKRSHEDFNHRLL